MRNPNNTHTCLNHILNREVSLRMVGPSSVSSESRGANSKSVGMNSFFSGIRSFSFNVGVDQVAIFEAGMVSVTYLVPYLKWIKSFKNSKYLEFGTEKNY